MATREQIAVANATSRTNGAVGKNAVVPRLVRDLTPKSHLVLDFGAGKDAQHVKALRQDGWQSVDGYEFGENRNAHHLNDGQIESFRHMYDCVYASNVLNVQGDIGMLSETIGQAAGFMHWRGKFIANYPASPRKAGLTPKQVESVLKVHFQSVTRCKTTTPTFICEGLRGL